MGIAFALAASACWGSADFLGGLKAKRYSALAVLLTIEVSRALIVLIVIGVAQDPFPSTRATLCALGAGTAGIVALGAFYRALAIGTMSIVAPISATGVALPVIVGIATGDRPGPIVIAGLVVTTRRRDPRLARGPRGRGAGRRGRTASSSRCIAAVGFGTYFIGADVAADESVLWTVLLGRLVAVPFVGALVFARARDAAAPRRPRLLCLAGAGDLLATTGSTAWRTRTAT